MAATGPSSSGSSASGRRRSTPQPPANGPGRGRGSDGAVALGLRGGGAERVDPAPAGERARALRAAGRVELLGKHSVAMGEDDLVLHRRVSLPFHPNGLRFFAYAGDEVV